MDYEKMYKEALKRVRRLHDRMLVLSSTDALVASAELEFIFPELTESEDERIRQELIDFIQWAEDRGTTRHDYHQAKRPAVWIAWLEKQKEASKAIEAVDRIDKYIDEHLANAHDMKDSNPDKKYYRGWDDALGEMARILQDVYSGEKQKESLHISETCKESADSFTDEDERIRKWLYDYISNCPNNNFAFYGGVGKDAVLNYLEKQKEEEGYEAIPVESTLEYKLGFKAGKESEKQKEQKPAECIEDSVKYEEGFKAGRESGLRDGQKYVLNNLDSYGLCKPAEWSDEDEKKITFLERLIRYNVPEGEYGWVDGHKGGFITKSEAISKLKSLRPQPQGTYKQVIHTIFGMLKDKDFYEIQPSHRVSLLNDIRVKCKDAIECAPILDEPQWKPSEEQMKALNKAIPVCMGVVGRDAVAPLESLCEQLEKLM